MLEAIHREEEDRLYRKFKEQREREHNKVATGIQEEWEVELEKLTSKFERELSKKRSSKEEYRNLTIKQEKEKREFEKNMTLKREKKKESVARKLLEQERAATAALVEKHSKEMMNLIQEKKAEHDMLPPPSPENGERNGGGRYHDGDASSSRGSNGAGGVSREGIPAGYPTQPPPPVPPPYAKSQIYKDPSVFAEVDQRAINVAQEDQKTFTDLVRQLVAGTGSDVEKARAIFRWITVKNLNSIMFEDNERGDTPMGLLRGIKFGTESYHVLFKRLCR